MLFALEAEPRETKILLDLLDRLCWRFWSPNTGTGTASFAPRSVPILVGVNTFSRQGGINEQSGADPPRAVGSDAFPPLLGGEGAHPLPSLLAPSEGIGPASS